MSPVKVIICGAKGRMGRTLAACAQSDPELQLAGEIDQGDDLAKVIARGDVVVDFSIHEATAAVARIAAEHKKALVIGTTGHSEREKNVVSESAKVIPVVWSANFSTGVNALFWMTRKVAEIVGNHWEAEIVETHHTAKKDAPSGTAKRLQEILKRVRSKDATAHAFAHRRRRRRSHGDIRHCRRTDRVDPSRQQPGGVCARSAPRREMGGQAKARFVRHGGRVGAQITEHETKTDHRLCAGGDCFGVLASGAK